MKYCGIVTPFKGVRVYAVTAMGLPGSEVALEEVLSRVLGEEIMSLICVKNADDLYVGGNTLDELYTNWERVLTKLKANNLKLSGPKTVIAPKSTLILGWLWQEGTLQANPHSLAPLSVVTPPKTVRLLRSFIGAYKVLSRVLQGYSQLMQPLDAAVAGKQSHELIAWSDELLHAFKTAQSALKNCKTITLPRPSDTLWLVTDGSVKERGMGATLYIMRMNKLHLAGFFSARLRPHQVTWLPCEQEALAISAAITHFSPLIIESRNRTHVLTDCRACVLAYGKLCRGEFSSSARVAAFLTTASRYQLTIDHLAGQANLPSDFASRNPVDCQNDNKCQVCQFVTDKAEEPVVVRAIQDVLNGSVGMPFTSRPAWIQTQQDCPDLRRTHAHLKQGTRPQKKITNISSVKRYLNKVTIASDGLLVVREASPLRGYREKIVVPEHALIGLLTALHMKFDHPTAHQLKLLSTRYFFALNIDTAIDDLSCHCYTCAALKSFPKTLSPQSTSNTDEGLALRFAMDVMNRWKQHIVILREAVSSYTLTCFSNSEKSADLVEAICILCAEVRNLSGITTIRIDPAPGFVASANNPMLRRLGIVLDKGREKNVNKNPIAEKAVGELGQEILRMSPDGGPLPRLTLAMATASLNSRIRRDGLSSREIWTQRDQFTGEQLPFEDRELVQRQHEARLRDHKSSEKSKAPKLIQPAPNMNLKPGDLVLLKHEHDKTKAREKYMVASISGSHCKVRKFTKDQFRTKLYEVKRSDCIPLTPPREQTPYMDIDEPTDNHNNEYVPAIHTEAPHLEQSLILPNIASTSQSTKETVPPDISPPLPVTPQRDKLETGKDVPENSPTIPFPPEIITVPVPEAEIPHFSGEPSTQPVETDSGRPQRTRFRPARLNDYIVRIERNIAFDNG